MQTVNYMIHHEVNVVSLHRNTRGPDDLDPERLQAACLQTDKLFEVVKESGDEKRHGVVSIRVAVAQTYAARGEGGKGKLRVGGGGGGGGVGGLSLYLM